MTPNEAFGRVVTAATAVAVAVGTVKVTATSGSFTSTADVVVEANPCTTPITMTAGQVRSFTGGSTVSCITLAASAGASDYVVIATNTRPVQDDVVQYSVSLQQAAGLEALAILSGEGRSARGEAWPAMTARACMTSSRGAVLAFTMVEAPLRCESTLPTSTGNATRSTRSLASGSIPSHTHWFRPEPPATMTGPPSRSTTSWV